MEIIKPLEIASKIMSLFSEAKKYIVVVSPYYNFNKWKKLNRVFEDAKKSGVKFSFYVRKGEFDSIENVKKIGFNPYEIEMLHAKIYFNESEAIISSMNLNESSDIASLDIGMATETEKEYESIVTFFKKFLKINSDNILNKNEPISESFNTVLVNEIIHKKELNQNKKELYFINDKYKEPYNFHVPSLVQFLKDEYPNNKIEFIETDESRPYPHIKVLDFAVKGIKLEVSSNIDVRFDNEYFYSEIKNLNIDTFQKTFPQWRFFWNRNVLNIYEPKQISYPVTENGLRDKVDYFLSIIREVSTILKRKVPQKGYNRY